MILSTQTKNGVNMVYTVISIVCIVILLLLFVNVVYRIATLKRPDRIAYIKNFKNGKFFLVYLAAYPLCYIAERYSGMEIGASFFVALKDAIDLVVVKFDFSTPLFKENTAYYVAVYVCLVLVTLNTFMLSASVFWQMISNGISLASFNKGKTDKCIIIGYNDKSVSLYKSCYDKKLMVGVFKKEQCDKMYVDNITYKSVNKETLLFDWLDDELDYLFKKFKGTNAKLNIIVNTGLDATNLDMCGRFVNFIKSRGPVRCSKLHKKQIEGYNETKVNVEYDDCNPFCMITMNFGKIAELSKHESKPAPKSTILGFNNLSNLFTSFIGNFETPLDGTKYLSTADSDALDSYTAFYNKAVELYNCSLVPFTKNINNDLSRSAVIGLNKPYTVTFGSDVSPKLVDFKSVIARLFGFKSTSNFTKYAQKLADKYAKYRDNTSNFATMNKALTNGCFYTDNGSFVFPIVVKNELSDTVLTYLIIDNEGLVSVWVNDITAALKATNFNNSYHEDKIINNELYCKNTLFVTDSFINNIDMYVYGDREYEDVYEKYEEQSLGCLHYISEHKQIAIDLIDKHPFTEFMTDKHFDKETSLLRPNTKINVALVGFGKVNQQVFLTSVANNQFLKADENGNPVFYPVTYHLFDRNETGEHKNINHTYYRYEHVFFDGEKPKVDVNDYLPLPPIPAISRYSSTDINSLDFYDIIKDALSGDDTALNFIVVALGNDYINIDMANKLVAKLREWKLDNARVFVRIREPKVFEKSSLSTDPRICVSFGNERDVVFDYAHVTNEKFTEMAIMRSFYYHLEHDMKRSKITPEDRQKSRNSWHKKCNIVQKESNMYGVLSLKLKLNLMGLSYVEKSSELNGLSYDEYMEIYAKDDMPDVETVDGTKQGIVYPAVFKDSRRKNLAVLEHYRWNAYMIMNGFIPSTKDVILNEVDENGKHTNGKSYSIRRHGNLTTFDGLYEFRKLVAARDKVPEIEKDVIKYDYQHLDGAYELLDDNGYKIVKIQ